MRDPKRIDEITAKLNEIWHKYPDMRFWQLLLNISWDFKGDAFFMEDDKVIAALEKVDKEGF
jgi:uncharacterized protein YihD (DUF1040 family)